MSPQECVAAIKQGVMDRALERERLEKEAEAKLEQQLEEYCKHNLVKTVDVIRNALKEAAYSGKDSHKIILHGSGIPNVLLERFGRRLESTFETEYGWKRGHSIQLHYNFTPAFYSDYDERTWPEKYECFIEFHWSKEFLT